MPECFYCGRIFPQLYKLTPEDIQRDHIRAGAYEVVCAECLDKIRLAARLVPEQSIRQSIRNFSWMIPFFSLSLVLAAILYSLVRVEGLGELGLSSQWIGAGAVLIGTLMVWDRSKNRYGFTHDLRWTLNSKRVNLGIAIVLAGLVVSLLSIAFPK